ncbi:MAG: hypothetical protein KC417_04695 [Myxococcales bacterium]|nr:hypothetical protein [Myxococcales bacterium]
MRHSLSLVAVLTATALVSVPMTAFAGGYEFPSLGTRPLGRGGASFARSDDPLALLYDPANLASLPGPQLLFNATLAFEDACYTRSSAPGTGVGTNGDGVPNTVDDVTLGSSGTKFAGENFANVPWPTVCNDAIPTVMPTLLYGMKLTPELGIAGGLLVPSAIGFSRWGDTKDGIISSGGTDVPIPSRYQLLESKVIFLQPTIGVGYAPHPRLKVGLALQWGFAVVDFLSNTATFGNSMLEAVQADVRTHMVTSDLFIPGINVSTHWVPHDNVDVMLGFRWQDAVRASGHIDFTTNTYGSGSETEPGNVPEKTRIHDVTFKAPQPWSLRMGLRYADRIKPRAVDSAGASAASGRVEDSMANERWDVEFDAQYEHSSSLYQYVIGVPSMSTVGVTANTGGNVTTNPLPVPSTNLVPHNWQDQISLRLGGDYNILPGFLATRLGVSFETSGVDPSYMQLDFWPVQRFGVHAGATIRLGRFDLSVAYAHFFQETITTSPSEAKLPQLAAVPPPAVTNAGTYMSNMDVFSLGLTWNL